MLDGSRPHRALGARRLYLLSILSLMSVVADAASRDRILGAIDVSRTRVVAGNVHRLAQAQYDRGEASPGLPMKYMVMLLQPSASQQAELTKLVAEQQNPASSTYHKWLTPEEFGERFGVSTGDLGKITGWL